MEVVKEDARGSGQLLRSSGEGGTQGQEEETLWSQQREAYEGHEGDQSKLKPYQPSRGSRGALGKEITKIDRNAEVPGHGSTQTPESLHHLQADPKKMSQVEESSSVPPKGGLQAPEETGH